MPNYNPGNNLSLADDFTTDEDVEAENMTLLSQWVTYHIDTITDHIDTLSYDGFTLGV